MTTEIGLRDQELEDARWFTRADFAVGRRVAAAAAVHIVPADRALVRCRRRRRVCATLEGARPGYNRARRKLGNFGLVLCAAFFAGFIDAIVGGGGLIQLPALFAGYPTVRRRCCWERINSAASAARPGRCCAICVWCNSAARAAACRRGRICRGARRREPGDRRVAGAVSPLVPVMLTLVLIYVLRHKDLGALHAPVVFSRRRNHIALAAIGGIGLYDGFFGPGTGSFLMLLFIRFYGFDFLHASVGARTINVATNAGALLFFGIHGEVSWGLGVALGGCNAAGSVLGAHTAVKHGSKFVRAAFIAIVIALIAKTACDAWRAHHLGAA